MNRACFTLAGPLLAVAAAVPASASDTDGHPPPRPGDLQPGRGVPVYRRHLDAATGIADLRDPDAGPACRPPGEPARPPASSASARRSSSSTSTASPSSRRARPAPASFRPTSLIKEVPGSFKCPDVYGLPHFDDKGNLHPLPLLPVRHGRAHLVEPELHPAGHPVHPGGGLRLPRPPAPIVRQCRATPPSTRTAGSGGWWRTWTRCAT